MDPTSESFSSSGRRGNKLSDSVARRVDDEPVLRLTNPAHCTSSCTSTLMHDFADAPILISTLTITEDHPLMAHSSPDSPPSTRNFPDLILHSHKCKNTSSDRTLHLCSGEDECLNREICSLYGEVEGEGYSPHNGPQRNTSKNNLYFSDNVITPDTKSPDGDELRNFTTTTKSNIQPDLVDSGNKYTSASHTYSSMSNHFHLDNSFNHNITHNKSTNRINTMENNERSSVAILQHALNIPESSVPITKKVEETVSVMALQEDSQVFSMRRNSWSNSCSSMDSLCGCSTKSEEENIVYRNDEHLVEKGDKIPEYSLKDERTDARKWLKIILPSGERRSVDMKVIEPYKRVLSHGGYALSGRRDAIVVFSACFLPDSCRVDYNYVMDNLFLYVLTTMEQLVTDDYILIYLHGSASKRSMPTFHWLKKCYQLIDRRLRKSLKHLYLVHPTFWLKSVVFMTRPFISSKFFSKLTYVHSLDELSNFVPVEYAAIPERVRRFDSSRS